MTFPNIRLVFLCFSMIAGALTTVAQSPHLRVPPDGDTHELMREANACRLRKDYKKAILFYCKVISSDAHNHRALRYRAECRNEEGLYEDALSDVEAIIRRDSSRTANFHLAVLILRNANRIPEALKWSLRGARNASSPEAQRDCYVQTVRLACRNAMYLDALNIVEEGLNRQPDFHSLWIYKGFLLNQISAFERALEFLTGLVPQPSKLSQDDQMMFFTELSIAYRMTGDLLQAKVYMDRSIFLGGPERIVSR